MMRRPDEQQKLTGRLRSLRAPARCPYCGEPLVAPLLSEFVDGSEIRHHWACEDCGQASRTEIALAN